MRYPETDPTRPLDRRTVLELGVAATTALAGCSGVGPGTETEHIELGAESSGWVGIGPASIDGATNPTLELTTGTTYALTWENHDGEKHDLVITDDSGTELATTGATKSTGAKQTVAFAAKPAMVSYHDTYHPETLRGGITVSSE